MNEPKYKMTKKEFEKWHHKNMSVLNFISNYDYAISLNFAYKAYCKAWRDCEKYERWVNE